MSDFLSKFDKEKYSDFVEEQEKNGAKGKRKTAKPSEDKAEVDKGASASPSPENAVSRKEESVVAATSETLPSASNNQRRYDSQEELEIDPTYKRRKRRRLLLIIAGSVVACALLFWVYYSMVHVEMEDFVDKPVSDARTWASENGVEIELKQEYSMEYDANQIISQSVPAGDNVRKGKTITFVSSIGADPEEVLPLPDFSEMTSGEIDTWIEENKAENLKLVAEFSDDVEDGEFLRLEIRDSSISEEEYRRKDNAAVYVSKGKEVFEKNITVPDFKGKPRAEVEQWAESNNIEMKYEEKDSNSVEPDMIISQSIEPDEKVAKKDKMKVVVSLGKATVVPNFNELMPDEAASAPGLMVTVKQRFHANVAYGRLISQSIEADTKLTEQDESDITVVYSEGKPYLRDYRGQLEGDLPRLFFEDYQSKGANITYTVKYVDSPEIKGTVVGMSAFNQYVPMTYTVEISVSKNASASPTASIPDDIDFDDDDDFNDADGKE
ncbi:serine/threonine protein kinase [Evansella caseinilytica]|uniref:Serine/threonine protein kinase n=1 Tax=Evansella caseinilytica TaxID=1503961 RepID=A0A1H3TEZ5_9BACI|nr:PASTA domain-containing protein [Evansella caseinilytica]SDZ48806.1 serine/threonine protein kinase [Evansella caseinilytica]